MFRSRRNTCQNLEKGRAWWIRGTERKPASMLCRRKEKAEPL